MGEPSFARLPFGFWTSILVGQIKRKHYIFASEGKTVTGFLGWARTSEEVAERWLRPRRARSPSPNPSTATASSSTPGSPRPIATNRFLLDQLRVIGRDGRLVYAKRFYKDGRVRPVKLSVNDAVAGHIVTKGLSKA